MRTSPGPSRAPMLTVQDLRELKLFLAEAAGTDTADEVLFRLGRRMGEREAARDQGGELDERARVERGLARLRELGFGNLRLELFEHDPEQRSCRLVGRLSGPPEVTSMGDETVTKEGLLCRHTVGFLTGLTAGITGLDVVCTSFDCVRGCDERACRFEVRPSHAWKREDPASPPPPGSARFYLGALGSVLGERDIALADLFETTSDAILLLDRDGVIRFWNQGAEKIFGYLRNEVVGRRFDFLLPDDLLAKGEPDWILARTEESGSLGNFITRRLRKDGAEIIVSLTRTTLHDSRGLVVGSAAFLRDITEQKRTEDQLERSRNLAALGEFAATVAHEIKNPLAGLYAAVQILARDLEQADERGGVFEEMAGEIRRLDATTDALLRFAHPPRPHMAPTELRSFLRERVAVLRRQPSLEHHEIVLECPEDLAPAIDPNLATQVFQNLVLNAAQAMDGEGGTIRIRVTTRGDHIQIDVEDSGPGIPAQAMKHLFEPFFTTKTRGSGLGLAVARRNVESMGGSIEAENRDAGGARFRVTIPHGVGP